MHKLLLLLLLAFTGTSSIYDVQVTGSDGQPVNLGDYSGKKILLVNTASSSEFTSQYASLEQLYQLYKDSLVIIAFPSNSFNHDTAGIDSIKSFIASQYNVHFLIAAKNDVKGDSTSPVFQWLTHTENNGVMNVDIKNDFYKFLIDSSGHLVGAFDCSVDPMSDVIQSAVTANN